MFSELYACSVSFFDIEINNFHADWKFVHHLTVNAEDTSKTTMYMYSILYTYIIYVFYHIKYYILSTLPLKYFIYKKTLIYQNLWICSVFILSSCLSTILPSIYSVSRWLNTYHKIVLDYQDKRYIICPQNTSTAKEGGRHTIKIRVHGTVHGRSVAHSHRREAAVEPGKKSLLNSKYSRACLSQGTSVWYDKHLYCAL